MNSIVGSSSMSMQVLDHENENIELTILLPCLNEAETIELCIEKAMAFLTRNNVRGEILIADNGSSDGSQQLAIKNGARVITVRERGYGSAGLLRVQCHFSTATSAILC